MESFLLEEDGVDEDIPQMPSSSQHSEESSIPESPPSSSSISQESSQWHDENDQINAV